MREVSNNPVHVSCDGDCPECRTPEPPRPAPVRVFKIDKDDFNREVWSLMRDNRGHVGLR